MSACMAKKIRWAVYACAGRIALVLLAGALAVGCGGKLTPEKLFQTGLRALQAGELAVGKERLEQALAAAPEAAFAAEAHNWLGLAHWQLGEPTAAVKNFDAAMQLNPAAFEPVYNQGSLKLELGDVSTGISLLRRAADLEAKDTRALLRIGDWTTRNGRWDLARRMYFEAQKRDPRSPVAATGLGRVALLEGNQAQAETFFMQALEIDKNFPPALYNLGVLHAQIDGHGEQAREYFRNYLAVAPQGARATAAAARVGGQTVVQTSFTPPASTQPKMTAGLLWADAQNLLRTGDRDAAYTKALQAVELAREGGDAAQAGEILRRAVEAFGDRAAIQLAIGEYWLSQGEPQRAYDALIKAQALEPDSPMVLLKLARAATALEEYDTAVIALRRLVELEPGNPDALWSLAETYSEKLGMIAKGSAAYRDFERLFASDSRAGEVAARIRALEEAGESL